MLLGKFARVVTGAAARAIIETAKIKSDAFMGNPAAAVEGADLRATASRPAYQSHPHMDKRMLQRNVYVNTFDPASRRSGKCRLGTYGRELGHWPETAFWAITPVKPRLRNQRICPEALCDAEGVCPRPHAGF